jgi:hypothetical protein
VPLTPAERAKAYRERKRLHGLYQPSTSTAALRSPDDETPMGCTGNEATTPMECTRSENYVVVMDSPEISVVQPRKDFDTRWTRSNRSFNEAFLTHDFGHACDVCDRLWFRRDLKSPTTNHVAVLRTKFDDPNLAEFSVCNTCRRSLNSKKIPPLAKTHGFPQESIEYFMFQMLGAYSEAIRLIFPSMNPDTETPTLLCGDFNIDVTQNKSFVNFMKSRFSLDCRSSTSTTLDLTFTRNVSVQTLPYVSYFMYHRPVLNRLILNNDEQ